jgi:hypothetical protein
LEAPTFHLERERLQGTTGSSLTEVGEVFSKSNLDIAYIFCFFASQKVSLLYVAYSR